MKVEAKVLCSQFSAGTCAAARGFIRTNSPSMMLSASRVGPLRMRSQISQLPKVTAMTKIKIGNPIPDDRFNPWFAPR